MHRLLRTWVALLVCAAGLAGPSSVRALTTEDVVYQPANAESDAIAGRFIDKFVYYERDRFFVPTRLLVGSDIKACVDLRKTVCSTRYYSRAEVLKAASLYFAFPIATAKDVVRTSLRRTVGNHLMHVTTKRSMTAKGLLLLIDVEQRETDTGAIKRFSRRALFKPSRGFAGLRMTFGEQVVPNAWTESLFRLRQNRLRAFANAVVRINNHFYSKQTGRNRIRHGSGFFYGSRNRIMTAWHNLSPNPDCRNHLRCTLRFLHTDSRGVKRRFKQTVTITAHNADADFAILQIRLPDVVPAQVLPVARKRIGPEVSVVGYPAPGFDLLYSHGYLNSLTAGTTRLVASAYVVGGFSGAPVVDLSSGRIVGFAKAWQRPRGQNGDGGPVSLNIVKVLQQVYGI